MTSTCARLGGWLAAISATTTAPLAAAAPATPPAGTMSSQIVSLAVLPIKTSVDVRIKDPLSSKTVKIGDAFGIELAAPIIQDGKVIVPAGIGGRGEVVHAAKAGWGGRAGELILAVRYLDCGSIRIPLGHFHFSQSGSSNVGGAFVAGSLLLPTMFMVTGGEVQVPAGTIANAQVTANVALADRGAASCAASAG